jgi:uncharacterized protein YfeS
VESGGLEAITEDAQNTSETIGRSKRPQRFIETMKTIKYFVLTVPPVQNGDLEAAEAVKEPEIGLETPKAIRQSARRKSATPSKVQETIGKCK